MITQLNHHELHRCVHGDIGEQFRGDAGFVMLKHAVPEPVPARISGPTGSGQRRRRPESTGFLVANVERLAATVTQRVIVPCSQPELVSVFHPGIPAPTLADDRTNVRAGDDIGPRRRRVLTRL